LDRFLDIYGFVDVDWVGDLDKRRSTSGYVFNLFGGFVVPIMHWGVTRAAGSPPYPGAGPPSPGGLRGKVAPLYEVWGNSLGYIFFWTLY